MFNCLHDKGSVFCVEIKIPAVFCLLCRLQRVSHRLRAEPAEGHVWSVPTTVLILFRGNIWPPSCAFWADSSSIRHTGSVQQEQESSQRTASRREYKANDLWSFTESDAPAVALKETFTFNRGSYFPWSLCLCNRELSLSSSVYNEELQPHIEAWIILFYDTI